LVLEWSNSSTGPNKVKKISRFETANH